MNIRSYDLHFGDLTAREATDLIVLHHSNGGFDIDFSAAQIHDMHLNFGYSGIGYHFVIRKDGTLELARPELMIGAHALGHNFNSIGICFSGDFSFAHPTDQQLNTAADLISDLCKDYDVPCDREHILPHRDLNETDCPGINLLVRIDELIRLANSELRL